MLPVALAWSARPPRLDRIESRDWGNCDRAPGRLVDACGVAEGASAAFAAIQHSSLSTGSYHDTGKCPRRSRIGLLHRNIASCVRSGLVEAGPGLIIAALIDGLHKLAAPAEISGFLAQTERRAFKQAMFAVRDEDAALDIVQDAMLKLTENYADKPAAELPMLFQRILQNTIHDHFRRQKVRSTWTTLLSAFGSREERDDDYDPLETLQAKSDSNATADPAGIVEQMQTVGVIEQALSRLPARQREAFLLRYWEELDVAETAAAMGCSEGSVKTHCSRAVHALAEMLKARGVNP